MVPEVQLNGPHHHLSVCVDESSLITIRHRRLHDELIVTVAELDELVARAPEIRAQVQAAWAAINGQRGGGR